ncbi:MAG: cyanophycinase, partial [Bacteroidota bacterium]
MPRLALFLPLLLGLLPLSLFGPVASGQGSVLVVGGGSTPSDGLAWFVERAANKQVVVADYTNDPGLGIEDALEAAGATVTYLPISSTAIANDPATRDAILAADGIFLPGGDQWRYVSRWNSTLAEDAIAAVFARGGVIGGTSAGAMVLSSVTSDAQRGSATSRGTLRDPQDRRLTLTDDFLDTLMPGTVVDTHFFERGRIGRLMAMMAQHHAASGAWVTGIGLDADTGLGIGPDGVGEVFGGGTVSLLYATPATISRAEADTPLWLSDIRLVQVTEGFHVNVETGDAVTMPDDAEPFVAATFEVPPRTITLDGSADTAAWLATDAPLDRALAALAPGAAVTVLAAPDATAATTLTNSLASRGFAATLVGLDASTADDATAAAQVREGALVVLAGLDLDDATTLLAPTSAVGAAFAAAPSVALLGDDAKLAGDAVVDRTEFRCSAAYDGLLRLRPALDLAPGLVVLPRAFDGEDCYRENRTAGALWALTESDAAYALLASDDAGLTIEDGTATVAGQTSVVLVDARATATTARPFRRQNAALLDATIHALPPGATFILVNTVADEPTPLPATSLALTAYPNPASETLTLEFDAGTAPAAVTV